MKHEFPQYRQLGNLQVFFEITDEENFIEYRKMGTKWIVSKIHATQFPEILRIRDMLSFENPFVSINQRQFEIITSEAILKNN